MDVYEYIEYVKKIRENEATAKEDTDSSVE